MWLGFERLACCAVGINLRLSGIDNSVRRVRVHPLDDRVSTAVAPGTHAPRAAIEVGRHYLPSLRLIVASGITKKVIIFHRSCASAPKHITVYAGV